MKPKMKVLHIFNSLMPSGAETMLAGARNVLEAEGVRVDVVATQAELGPFAAEMAAAGYGVRHVPHRHRRGFDVVYSVALYRLIRRGGYSAVQVHPEAWRRTNCLVARLAGVRNVVSTAHNVFRPSGLCGLRVLRRRLITWALARLGVTLVAIGDSVLENERRFGARPLLVYNWIDAGRFRPCGSPSVRADCRRRLAVPDSAKVVMVVGNCNFAKNHEFFFRMFAKLPPNCVAVHVGREDEPSFHERALAESLGVAGRVRFLGPRSDVADLLEGADAYVMCSRNEGLPIAALEALCKGVPSVVSDVVGLRDVARVPLCALSPLDEDRFAACVQRQLELPPERLAALRKSSSDVIASVFSMERNVREYVRLWAGEKTPIP